jgi:secondary thiamine-phosphate synthase enzyme
VQGITVRSTSSSFQVTAPGRRCFVDVTDALLKAIEDAGISEGFAIAFTTHTTCALIINEWENGVLADLTSRVGQLIPDDAYYAHDDLSVRTQNLTDNERRNGAAHVVGMIMGGTSHAIPISNEEPVLGRWQRLFLCELDEPKERTIRIHTYGE